MKITETFFLGKNEGPKKKKNDISAQESRTKKWRKTDS